MGLWWRHRTACRQRFPDPHLVCDRRQTVWKEMVERERRKGDVRVESAQARQRTWWDKIKTSLALLTSIVAFILLLGACPKDVGFALI